MLVDTTHPEETRVVVMDGQRLEEFDFESAARKQIAGNIYLAKVMRVEPSLQAAFVDYGGNRHGFLAFSEIHPDYYQVSPTERAAINAAQERSMAAAARSSSPRPDSSGDDEDTDTRGSKREGRGNSRHGSKRPARRVSTRDRTPTRSRKRTKDGAYVERSFRISGGLQVRVINENDVVDLDLLEREFAISGNVPVRVMRLTDEERGISEDAPEDTAASGDTASDDAPQNNDTDSDDTPKTMAAAADHLDKITSDEDDDAPEDEAPESLGGDDEWDEEEAPLPRVRLRDYKIQDVIKRRQIMLIQINKEERGNKGAAVTTYLSLAGRYCVLMPNTAKGGGISRKITNAPDRKRLKDIAGELEVPKGMGLIIRTAGAQRTRAEIKRDYEYLLRQWDAIRTLTMDSYAPAPIYEEGSLIKRSIRDLYSKDISEIVVEGNAGYREARDYMKMLMPSHAKNVVQHKGKAPLFIHHKVENQLAAMFNPVVQLKSGGYIVIGITEALVAIDVNSGRSTRESSIEDTAAKTNLEAAEEVARQFRLRDLAGLIVIDFIDMNERRNNAAVERKLKECLSSDRARIQVGRISSFGLLEMSRQRLRPGMLEATTTPCAHCHGTGIVRSDDTMALTILREIEEEAMREIHSLIRVEAPVSVANFLNNHKRDRILDIERRYGIRVIVEGDMAKVSPDFGLVKLKLDDVPEMLRPAPAAVSMESTFLNDESDYEDDEDDIDDSDDTAEATSAEAEADSTDLRDEPPAERDSRRRSPKRNKDKRGKDRKNGGDPLAVIDTGDDPRTERKPFAYADKDAADDDNDDKGRNRRNRRGGRNKRGGKRQEAPREFGEAAAFAMLTGRDALDRALPKMFKVENAIMAKVPDAAPRETPDVVMPEDAAPAQTEAQVNGTVEEPTQEDTPAPTIDATPEASPEPEATIEVEAPPAPEAQPEPEATAPAEPEPAPPPAPKADDTPVPPAQVVDSSPAEADTRPKRSGWWSR